LMNQGPTHQVRGEGCAGDAALRHIYGKSS
jgi:hypothetical protein